MATIKFTHDLIEPIMTGVYPGNGAELRIYKGVKPTNLSTEITGTGSRSSDLLILFNGWNNGITLEIERTTRLTRYQPVVATATGTATWFLWHFGGNRFVMGDIGLPGSGADLIIGSTSITSGESYDLSNCYFRMPTIYTY